MQYLEDIRIIYKNVSQLLIVVIESWKNDCRVIVLP